MIRKWNRIRMKKRWLRDQLWNQICSSCFQKRMKSYHDLLRRKKSHCSRLAISKSRLENLMAFHQSKKFFGRFRKPKFANHRLVRHIDSYEQKLSHNRLLLINSQLFLLSPIIPFLITKATPQNEFNLLRLFLRKRKEPNNCNSFKHLQL